MKTLERATIAIIACLGLIGLHQAIAAFMNAHAWKGLAPSDWAAWVQAIGSIAAIVGAFLIARNQHTVDRLREIERRHLEEIRRFEIIQALLAKANKTVEAIAQLNLESQFGVVLPEPLEYLDDCRVSIEALPIIDMPHADLAIYCAALPRALRELKELLLVVFQSTMRVERMTAHQIERVEIAFSTVMKITSDASALCAVEISRRVGT